MKKRILALTMAAVMSVGMLVGCGSSAAKDEAPAETEETVDEAEESDGAEESADVTTVTDGVLVMGTNAAFPPYEFYEGEDVVGIDAEIAAAIADKLGLDLEIQDMDFGTLIAAVQGGKIDVVLAGMTVTDERKENVNFSDSYATGVQVIVVPEDSEIATVDDLEGKLIGVQEATTGHIYCEDDFGTDNVIPKTTGALAIQDLVQNKVDCVVIDKQPAIKFVEANEGLKILDTEYVTEDYAIAVSKDNEPLLNAINAALAELQEDGTIQTILDKYISAE